MVGIYTSYARHRGVIRIPNARSRIQKPLPSVRSVLQRLQARPLHKDTRFENKVTNHSIKMWCPKPPHLISEVPPGDLVLNEQVGTSDSQTIFDSPATSHTFSDGSTVYFTQGLGAYGLIATEYQHVSPYAGPPLKVLGWIQGIGPHPHEAVALYLEAIISHIFNSAPDHRAFFRDLTSRGSSALMGVNDDLQRAHAYQNHIKGRYNPILNLVKLKFRGAFIFIRGNEVYACKKGNIFSLAARGTDLKVVNTAYWSDGSFHELNRDRTTLTDSAARFYMHPHFNNAVFASFSHALPGFAAQDIPPAFDRRDRTYWLDYFYGKRPSQTDFSTFERLLQEALDTENPASTLSSVSHNQIGMVYDARPKQPVIHLDDTLLPHQVQHVNHVNDNVIYWPAGADQIVLTNHPSSIPAPQFVIDGYTNPDLPFHNPYSIVIKRINFQEFEVTVLSQGNVDEIRLSRLGLDDKPISDSVSRYSKPYKIKGPFRLNLGTIRLIIGDPELQRQIHSA